MTILMLLGLLIVVGLIFWGTAEIASAFHIPAPIVVTIKVFLVVVIVIWILSQVGMLPASVGPIRLR